jgi:hypothetical protein
LKQNCSTPKTTQKVTPKTTVKTTPKTTQKMTPKTASKVTPKPTIKTTQKMTHKTASKSILQEQEQGNNLRLKSEDNDKPKHQCRLCSKVK